MPENYVAPSPVTDGSENPQFLTRYLRYMQNFRSSSKATVLSVGLTLREFLQYIHYKRQFQAQPSTADAHKDLSICNMEPSELASITEAEVEEYLCFLDTEARNSTSTLRRKLTQLRQFFQYFCTQQTELGSRIPVDPVKNLTLPPRDKPTLNLLSDNEIARLLSAIDGSNAVRDYAIILLFLTTGMQLLEIVKLNAEDYDGETITVRGQSTRTIFLTVDCIDALNRYLQEYRTPLEEQLYDKALFVSLKRKKRLTCRCIQKMIDKHITSAGMESKGFTANDLRATAVVTIVKAVPSDNVPAVMDYLGYRSSHSTAFFSAVASSQRKKSHTASIVQQAAMRSHIQNEEQENMRYG